MYADPSLIRDRVVKVRFNDREAALVEAWVNYSGEEKAAFIRTLILEQARLDLGLQSGGLLESSEGPATALRQA